METRYTPRHRRRSHLSSLALSVRRALRPCREYREVSILDVLTEERRSIPLSSLSSRQARWGTSLLALGSLLILGNFVVCLTRSWAFSGLAIPAIILVGVGATLLELSPEAGVRLWWKGSASNNTADEAEASDSDGPSGVAA
ncbi:hypothetical protein [Actinomyces naeslundii]